MINVYSCISDVVAARAVSGVVMISLPK